MVSEITVQSSANPVTLENQYLVNVPLSLMANRLKTDLIYEVMASIVTKASSDMLEKHGEDILKTVLKEQTSFFEKIKQRIHQRIGGIMYELNILQQCFDNKQLCKCGFQHIQHSADHQFKSIDNLGYLELRYSKINDWIAGLKNEQK